MQGEILVKILHTEISKLYSFLKNGRLPPLLWQRSGNKKIKKAAKLCKNFLTTMKWYEIVVFGYLFFEIVV